MLFISLAVMMNSSSLKFTPLCDLKKIGLFLDIQ